MKMNASLMISLLALGLTAQAEQKTMDLSSFSQESPEAAMEAFISGDPGSLPQSCIDANITAEQNLQIKEAVATAKKDMIPLKNDLKMAFNEFEKTVKDSNSNISMAQSAGALVTEKISRIGTLKVNLATDILYRILKPEQKSLGFDCMKAMMRASMEKHMDKICKRRANPEPPAPAPGQP